MAASFAIFCFFDGGGEENEQGSGVTLVLEAGLSKGRGSSRTGLSKEATETMLSVREVMGPRAALNAEDTEPR